MDVGCVHTWMHAYLPLNDRWIFSFDKGCPPTDSAMHNELCINHVFNFTLRIHDISRQLRISHIICIIIEWLGRPES